MRYFLRTTIGLGLLVAGIVALAYIVYQLLQVGTCASGGPFEIARECPEGTERLGFGIPVAMLTMFAGAGIYGTRGPAPGSRGKPGGSHGWALGWSGLFLGVAFAALWGIWGPDANPPEGAKLGGLIVAGIFIPLGLLPLLGMGPKGRQAAARASGSGRPEPVDAGVAAELQGLERLRERGAIDDAELERLRDRLIDR